MQPNLKKRAFALAGVAGALTLGGLVTSCSTVTPPATGKPPAPRAPSAGPGVAASGPNPPPAPREFRAAWVSTVANIDWPSKSSLSAAQQQAEAIAILDRAKGMNLNAIVLQVRPSADAIYASEIEPWSEYLSGAQGRAPQPWYDPLKFWVTQAHARGLELHAWFNPYRARHATAKSPVSASHISRTSPSAVKPYGRFLWMDPGEEAASKQTLAVILDVVKRYDIDGVHIDDYFYPYPIEAGAGPEGALDGAAGGKPELEFPDQPSWQRYQQGGGKLARADWRRQNVNQLIEALYKGIHAEKSWVRFGISPFGLGKPERRPAGIAGFSQYDKLYADAETWLENGWLDYLSPQLYWPINQAPQAYGVLLDYWLAQNTQGRHVWPGLFTSRIGAPTKAFTANEIVQQIGLTRTRPKADGHVHFSIAALMENRQGISDQLRAGHYAAPALVPATPWLRGEGAEKPVVSARRGVNLINFKITPSRGAAQYAIWSRHGAEWRFAVLPGSKTEWSVADDATLVILSTVDRLGNEGERFAIWTAPA